MKYFKRFLFLTLSTCLLYSCSKEYSLETGSTPPIADTTGNTCYMEKIIQTDYSTKLVEYSYDITHTADHNVSSIQLVDSLNNHIDNTFLVSYSAGKVQVDTRQYFVTGTDGKVTEFHGYEYPEDTTSERFTVKYTYNIAGQLIKRTEEYDALPGITSFQMDYTYSGNNLSRTEAKVNTGTTLQKFIDVTYEYETNKTIRNFMYLNSVAPEIFYFQSAVNLGPTSVNPLKKATTIFMNYSNGRDSTTVSNFVNYKYDSNNHITSFELTGDDFVVNNLYSGNNYRFTYSCY